MQSIVLLLSVIGPIAGLAIAMHYIAWQSLRPVRPPRLNRLDRSQS